MKKIKLKDLLNEGLVLKESKLDSEFMPWEVQGLISVLDKKPEFSKYKNKDSSYDDLYYENIPLRLFKGLNLSQEDLEKIHDSTDNYEGSISIQNNMVSISGGS